MAIPVLVGRGAARPSASTEVVTSTGPRVRRFRRGYLWTVLALLIAVPEFQEDAWRFWTDSQATFLCLVYLSSLVAFIRRPALVPGAFGLACLGLLLLTKESAAVTFAPFILLAGAIPLSRRLTDSGRKYALLATVLILMAFVGLGV